MDSVVNAPLKVNILIIDNDCAEVKAIKSWLDKDMRVPWDFNHCISVKEASLRIRNVDLVILKPEMEGFLYPKEFFKTIENMFLKFLFWLSQAKEMTISFLLMSWNKVPRILLSAGNFPD